MEHKPLQKYPAPQEKIRVMFVCMSNLNRSRRGEDVFKELVNKHGIDRRFQVYSSGVDAQEDAGGTQFDPEMAERYHILFAADFDTKKALLGEFRQPREKIINLGIPDNYPQSSKKLGEILEKKLHAWLIAGGHIKRQ